MEVFFFKKDPLFLAKKQHKIWEEEPGPRLVVTKPPGQATRRPVTVPVLWATFRNQRPYCHSPQPSEAPFKDLSGFLSDFIFKSCLWCHCEPFVRCKVQMLHEILIQNNMKELQSLWLKHSRSILQYSPQKFPHVFFFFCFSGWILFFILALR